jgi:hypothetical protein
MYLVLYYTKINVYVFKFIFQFQKYAVPVYLFLLYLYDHWDCFKSQLLQAKSSFLGIQKMHLVSSTLTSFPALNALLIQNFLFV